MGFWNKMKNASPSTTEPPKAEPPADQAKTQQADTSGVDKMADGSSTQDAPATQDQGAQGGAQGDDPKASHPMTGIVTEMPKLIEVPPKSEKTLELEALRRSLDIGNLDVEEVDMAGEIVAAFISSLTIQREQRRLEAEREAAKWQVVVATVDKQGNPVDYLWTVFGRLSKSLVDGGLPEAEARKEAFRILKPKVTAFEEHCENKTMRDIEDDDLRETLLAEFLEEFEKEYVSSKKSAKKGKKSKKKGKKKPAQPAAATQPLPRIDPASIPSPADPPADDSADQSA